ncbi:MAG TPA: hypothetical protein EYQ54_16525, partial [Myxococcales bacterium]|nr:hypothetical protein [Myxococcales bacterium]
MVAEEAAVVQGAPSLITDVQTLQTQVGSPAPGDPSVVDRLTSQGVTIGTNTVAATTAQASADSASTTAAAAQSTATANEAALTALQATLPSLQDFSGQDLTGADLSGQDLSMANLVGTRLVNADLRGANLYRANLSGADLNGADLRGANLDEALLVLTDLRQTRVGLSGGISTSMNNATVIVGPDADTGGGSYSYQVELIAESDQCVLTGLGIPCLSANGAVFSGGGGPQTTVRLAPNTQAVGASFLLDEFSQVSCGGGSDFSGSVVAPNVVFFANECTAAGLKAPGAHYKGWGIAPNSDLRGSLVELSSLPSAGSMPPDLSGSNLAGAHLRFVGDNVGTLLEGADLTGAWIDSTQIGSSPTVSFRSANLTNIELCDVSHPNCVPLSKLAGFDFADATLSGVNFIPYYGGLLPTSLDGVDLSDATLAN